MSEHKIREFIEARITEGDFPSAVWAVGDESRILAQGAAGFADTGDDRSEATTDTIYDLASLTKPLVTGLLTALLIENGKLALTDRISRFLAPLDSGEKRKITVEDLLAHRSGFEAWRPFYLEVNGEGREARLASVVRRIGELPLKRAPRTGVIYSDLNFILLGAIIEMIEGRDLAELADERIFSPLGLRDTVFGPVENLTRRVAANEKGNAYERRMADEMGFDTANYDWREEVIRGEVHDENCRFLGGISGHAGLFSTARETLVLCRQFLPGSTILLKQDTCRIFSRDLTEGLEQARSAAFQLAATEGSSANGVLPDNAFCHLGFTGTGVWIDPERRRFYVLLSNRTHGRKPPFADLSGARHGFLEASSGVSK